MLSEQVNTVEKSLSNEGAFILKHVYCMHGTNNRPIP